MASDPCAADVVVTPKTAAKDEASQATCSPTPSPPNRKIDPDVVRMVAKRLADQPIQETEPGVWAVLTALSKNARVRGQGNTIPLTADEHCLGRTVEDQFQIFAQNISGKHCKIYKDPVLGELCRHEHVPVFLKDTSSNGTFHNWTRLKNNSSPVKLRHGDIISLSSPPHDDKSFVFVYREVNPTSCVENGAPNLKRKSEDGGCGSKRLKGLGIGSPDGNVSLDYVRRLEKSNAELREQLEAHVVTIETLRTQVQHVKEFEEKQKQIDSNTELQKSIKGLDERLSVSKQSHVDPEIISSKKAIICELEGQLSEERNLIRREEHDKAPHDLKSALHHVQAEAEEEITGQAESHHRQQRKQKELFRKLQETEKETSLLVETLRFKLEDARYNLVTSEKKARELEAQLQDEQLVSANYRKKSDNLETELRKLKKEHENEGIRQRQYSCILAGFPQPGMEQLVFHDLV